MFRKSIIVLLLFCFSQVGYAATLIVDGGGQLLGASGVNVGGTFYDVSFLGGTCEDTFSGCAFAGEVYHGEIGFRQF